MDDVTAIRRVAQEGKDRDPRWYRVHRRASIYLTLAFMKLGMRPNQVSALMMVIGATGTALLAVASPRWNLVGFLLVYFGFLLDKVDGEIARLRDERTARGVLLDRFHHRIIEPALFAAAAVHGYRTLPATWVLLSGPVIMLLANMIEENQHIAPYIFYKRTREGARFSVHPPRPPRTLDRIARVLRPLKGFRMLIVALPLVYGSYLLEAVTHRPITAWYLGGSAVALAAYYAFQCWFYYVFQLDAELAEEAAMHDAGARDAGGDGAASPLFEPAGPSRAAAHERRAATRSAMKRTVSSAVCIAAAWIASFAASAAFGATYHVDAGNGSCSDAGPGTPASPYCTISAALTAHHTAGTTIAVHPGVYREQVTVPASGAEGSPIVLQALPGPNAPVVVCGSQSLATPASWTQFQQNVWRAASVNWSPVQVFDGDTRLAPYTGDPALMPSGSFMYSAGTGLYVNTGGGNPGNRPLEVGRRPYGFFASNRAYVTIDGFAVTRCDDRGIRTTNNASHVEVTRDSVTFSGRFGIQADLCSAIHVADCVSSDNADHGIALLNTTASTVERNECFRNARPGVRAANGISLDASTGNVIRANRTHDNQDSGINLLTGSDNALLVENVSYANGDHGVDHLHVLGWVEIGDVAYGNVNDGFSIEGNSNGGSLYNCIAVDNGLTTNHHDLWVDDSSSVGFVSNDNLFWNSSVQPPVKYRTTVYSTVTSYSAASGNDNRTLQADPRFVDASQGDFHLAANSPAIDNANSGVPSWPAQDADGHSRGDDPTVSNTGLGPVAFADRGAYEYTASGTVAVDPPAAGTPPQSGGTSAMVPNPVRAGATLEFTTARPGRVTVGIFDLRGRLLRTLAEGEETAAGRHVLAFDGRSLSGAPLEDGVYFFRIVAGEGAQVGRFVVSR